MFLSLYVTGIVILKIIFTGMKPIGIAYINTLVYKLHTCGFHQTIKIKIIH